MLTLDNNPWRGLEPYEETHNPPFSGAIRSSSSWPNTWSDGR